MNMKYLVIAFAIALIVVAGCVKRMEVPKQDFVTETPTDISSEVSELESLDEDVDVEDVEVNPDELSGLDF